MPVSISGTNGVTFPDSSLQAAAASPYVLKNRIINGAMQIDQRNAGASVTPASGAYTIDRWWHQLSQASKISVQRTGIAPAGFLNSALITSLSAYSVGASDYFNIVQNIEGFNTADLGWGTANAQTVTISFWVRSSLTGTFGGGVLNSDQSRAYPFVYTISSANTWEYKTVTIAGDTSGTWPKDNGIGLRLSFGLGVGSNFSSTAGSWGSGVYLSATGAVSVVGTNGATFYITGVQLEIGTSATPFERRLYNQELANCQRYFYKHASGTSQSIGIGYYFNSGLIATAFNLPVTMRVTPSLLQTTGTNYYNMSCNNGNDNFNQFDGVGGEVSTTMGVVYRANAEISGTAGQAGQIVTNNALSYIGLQAEL